MTIPASLSSRGARRYVGARQGSPWLMTFADMAILMVAFFAVIISFSNFSPQDFSHLSQAMGERFGGKATGQKQGQSLVSILPETVSWPPVVDFDVTTSPPDQPLDARDQLAVGEAVLADLARQVEPLLANAALQMQQTPQRVIVTLGSAGFFQSGSTDLDSKAQDSLTQLGRILGTAPVEMTIEGHADSQPVSGGRYRDNWELAAARAAAVLKILVESSGLPAGSFKIVSYGASRPAALETDATMLARNRRVDIEIKYR